MAKGRCERTHKITRRVGLTKADPPPRFCGPDLYPYVRFVPSPKNVAQITKKVLRHARKTGQNVSGLCYSKGIENKERKTK